MLHTEADLEPHSGGGHSEKINFKIKLSRKNVTYIITFNSLLRRYQFILMVRF